MASGGSKVESARSMPTKNCQAMSVKRQSTRGSPASALRHEMSREARQSAVTQRQAKGRTPWKVSGCNEHAQAPKKPRKHSEQEATTNGGIGKRIRVKRILPELQQKGRASKRKQKPEREQKARCESDLPSRPWPCSTSRMVSYDRTASRSILYRLSLENPR